MNSDITEISFPGLGIDVMNINRVAFTLNFGDKSFSIYWYGIIIVCGMLFAFIYANYRAKNEKITTDDVLDVGIWTIVIGVVGARLYYVLTSLDSFVPEPFNFWGFIKNVVNLRSGGLAIYGGIIGGILAICLVTRIKKINTLKMTDMIAPGVMVAQALGRWGNFFNAEAHGGIVSEGSPLYFLRMGLRDPNSLTAAPASYYHPTFLYESVWNLVGFFIINAFYKKKKFNGQISCMYLAWYGFGRMFIEGLRTDSLYVGSVRISQLVGFLCFIVFGGLLIAGLVYSKRFNTDGYEPKPIDRYLVPDVVDKNGSINGGLYEKLFAAEITPENTETQEHASENSDTDGNAEADNNEQPGEERNEETDKDDVPVDNTDGTENENVDSSPDDSIPDSDGEKIKNDAQPNGEDVKKDIETNNECEE